jgi:hypothetical protein
MAMISRRIWLRRNALVFEGKFAHPNDVFLDAAKYGFDSKGQQWVLFGSQELDAAGVGRPQNNRGHGGFIGYAV